MTDQDHRALVERLFPDLEVRTFAPLGDGWTSFTYEVNGEWIVQLPRDDRAAERLRMQATLLPELAREVSALVPVPESARDGPPALRYRRLDGHPADASLDGYWPERLGRFLYDLHSVPPEFVGLRAVPVATLREGERAEWAAIRAAIAGAVAGEDLAVLDDLVVRLLDDDANWTFAPVLAHNDLGPEHVLVDDRGDLVGVLDWEEAGLGDPVGDFAWWLHEMPSVGDRALAAYGGAPDRTFRERARLRWSLMPWHEIHHGVTTDQESHVVEGLRGARARGRFARG
ncbi:MAG TPA: phosphotransferase [Actinomycetota bacterium]